MSVLRIIPLTGTEIERQIAVADTLPNELTSSNDQHRLFLQNRLVGSVWHAGVASQTDMLNLWLDDERGCWPGDLCQRTDTGEVFGCVTRKGQQLADWILLVAAGLTVDAPLAGRGRPASHLSIPAATDLVPGHLTAADHAAFAAKVSFPGFGTTSATACVGNDARLSDARVASDVYAWAKAATKPAYTYSEVGADPVGAAAAITLAGLSGVPSTRKITSSIDLSADRSLTYSDVGAAPSSTVSFPGFGTSGSTSCVGNDARLSDARVASDVYAWAKAATKPAYTYSEVGADPVGAAAAITLAGLSGVPSTRKITSSIDLSADRNLTYSDVGAAPSSTVSFPGFGTSGSTSCVGNDARLSDARVASDVYAWAKAATKPAYTYSEVGADPVGAAAAITLAGLSGVPSTRKITSSIDLSADRSLTYSDVGAAPSSTVSFPGFGTTALLACVGNDARLSDSRPASDVYAWAKAATKPSYTYSEVGADVAGAAAAITLSGLGGVPTSRTINGHDLTANRSLTYSDVGAIPTALTSAYLLVGNASNVAAGVAMTGDISITNAGLTAIGANKVTPGMLARGATVGWPLVAAGSGADTTYSNTLKAMAEVDFRDYSAAFDVQLYANSTTALTANRTLQLNLKNANRTIALNGNPTLDDWFDQSVKVAATPQFARLGLGGAASATIPFVSNNASTVQGYVSGWCSTVGADPANGAFALGNAPSAQGMIQYDGLHLGALYLDNTLDDPTATIFLRTRTSGTPINALKATSTGVNVGVPVLSIGTTVASGANVASFMLLGNDGNAASRSWGLFINAIVEGDFTLYQSTSATGYPNYGSKSILYFDGGGNATFAGAIGIGVAPSAKLHIRGANAPTSIIVDPNSSGAGDAALRLIRNGIGTEELRLVAAAGGTLSGTNNLYTLDIIGNTTMRDFTIRSSPDGGTTFSSLMTVHPGTGGVQVTSGFGCNGKTPQTAYASGGLLAGVVAALVANGILSS